MGMTNPCRSPPTNPRTAVTAQYTTTSARILTRMASMIHTTMTTRKIAIINRSRATTTSSIRFAPVFSYAAVGAEPNFPDARPLIGPPAP